MKPTYDKHNIDDYIGKKFYHLTVIGLAKPTHQFSNKFILQCDCGKVIEEIPSRVLYGHKKTCGCRCPKPKTKSDHYGNFKDGRTKHPLYGTWRQMISRCENPKNLKYQNYGGRGIKICNEWHNFWSFSKWSESHGYSSNLTIDRIDPNGNYEPNNCRWVSWDIQSNNKNSCIYITFNKKTQTLKQWANEVGINPVTLKNRIKSGWDVEKALYTKPKMGNNQHKIDL